MPFATANGQNTQQVTRQPRHHIHTDTVSMVADFSGVISLHIVGIVLVITGLIGKRPQHIPFNDNDDMSATLETQRCVKILYVELSQIPKCASYLS